MSYAVMSKETYNYLFASKRLLSNALEESGSSGFRGTLDVCLGCRRTLRLLLLREVDRDGERGTRYTGSGGHHDVVGGGGDG